MNMNMIKYNIKKVFYGLLVSGLSLGVFIPNISWAVKLSDYTPYSYEVLFTNPKCATYSYENPIPTQGGGEIKSKTQNAYCKSSDTEISRSQPGSPHRRLMELLKDEKTKEIFLSSFTFSNSDLADALCEGIKLRALRVTMVLGKSEDLYAYKKANEVVACAQEGGPVPRLFLRGSIGSDSRLGLAHNKFILINPHDPVSMGITFGSGNLSAGTGLHHENWHFITASSQSYFARAHLCLMNGSIDHGEKLSEFKEFMRTCRKNIDVPEEEDIRLFAIPGDSAKMVNTLSEGIKQATEVMVAMHRFSARPLIESLEAALERMVPVRFVADDDLYWSGVYQKDMGRNSLHENKLISNLVLKGAAIHFVETYQDKIENPVATYMHHNKFLIINGPSRWVFTGAGNFSKSGFYKNFENYYEIHDPKIVEEMSKQFTHLWTDLSLSFNNMPTKLQLP